MKDALLNIGSIVEVEYDGEIKTCLIIGRRIIHFKSMRAWDYYSVPYPYGLSRDKGGTDEGGLYFNHYDIKDIVYKCDIQTEEVK